MAIATATTQKGKQRAQKTGFSLLRAAMALWSSQVEQQIVPESTIEAGTQPVGNREKCNLQNRAQESEQLDVSMSEAGHEL